MKKKISDRITGVILAVIMIMSTVSNGVYAAEINMNSSAGESEKFAYDLENVITEDINTNIEPVIQSNDSDTNILDENETMSTTEVETISITESKTVAEVENETVIETETITTSANKTESETSTVYETEGEIETEIENNTEVETETIYETENETEVEAETTYETETEVETEKMYETETETEVETETKSIENEIMVLSADSENVYTPNEVIYDAIVDDATVTTKCYDQLNDFGKYIYDELISAFGDGIPSGAQIAFGEGGEESDAIGNVGYVPGKFDIYYNTYREEDYTYENCFCLTDASSEYAKEYVRNLYACVYQAICIDHPEMPWFAESTYQLRIVPYPCNKNLNDMYANCKITELKVYFYRTPEDCTKENIDAYINSVCNELGNMSDLSNYQKVKKFMTGFAKIFSTEQIRLTHLCISQFTVL